MRITNLLAVVFSVLFITGCTKDDETPAEHPAELSIMFLPMIGNQEMQIAKP